jgi:hypothetical protein
MSTKLVYMHDHHEFYKNSDTHIDGAIIGPKVVQGHVQLIQIGDKQNEIAHTQLSVKNTLCAQHGTRQHPAHNDDILDGI